MKVYICGSPQWTYSEIIKDHIVRLHRESQLKRQRLLVIHGGEPGPETVAQEYCRELGAGTIIQEAVRVLGQNS